MPSEKKVESLERKLKTPEVTPAAGTAMALGAGATAMTTYGALESPYWIPAAYSLGQFVKYGAAAALGVAPTPLIPLAIAGLVGFGIYGLMKNSFRPGYNAGKG